jgi:hypothetical protein
MDLGRRAFVLRHLYVYPTLRIAYTNIPKNACTSFKQTLGIAEGWWVEKEGSVHDASRRHVKSSLLHLRDVDERIVVIRDPWRRLVSAYQNKFTSRDDAARNHAMGHGLAALLPAGADPLDATFAQFVQYVVRTPDRHLDKHWRPQSDFLLDSYTRWLRFEHLDEDAAFLADRGYPLRTAVGHGSSQLRKDVGPGWGDRPGRALRRLRRKDGALPTTENMYDDSLRALVADRYATDVELFQRLAEPSQR